MMRIALLLVAALSVSGCAFKTKQHSLFCVGACIHHEGQTEKGGPPEKPAPEVTDEAAKG